MFDSVTPFVLVCHADTKASRPDQCGGGAIRCGGDVADSDAPQLPISVHVTEVLAEPSEDWGYSLDLRGCSCTPRVCELVFRV